jgi:hypothetical protein
MKVSLIWVMLVTFTDLLLEVIEVVDEHQIFSHDIYFLDSDDLTGLGLQHMVDFLYEIDLELLAFLLQL